MKKFSLFSMIAMLFAVAACVRVPNPGGGGGGGGETDMRFTVTIPGTNPTPVSSTRASAHSDIDIENISLLVFEDSVDGRSGLFVERVEASDITLVANSVTAGGGASYTFTARIGISTDPRNIYFVANAHRPSGVIAPEDIIQAGMLAGKTEGQVWGYIPGGGVGGVAGDPGLRTPTRSSPLRETDMLPIVMWGKISLPAITSTQSVQNVKLLRTAAAIDVRNEVKSENFTIHRVSAGNIASSVPIAPSNIWSWSNTNPVIPYDNTLPETNTINQFGNDHSTGYWTEWNSAPTGNENLHYVNETADGALELEGDEPYLLVYATYDGTAGYYKLQMKNLTHSQPFDVRRNNRYIVSIIAVSGPGYATVADAVAGAYSNDELTFHVDEFDQLVSFVADGHDYIGVSCEEAYIIHEANSTPEVQLALVYAERDGNSVLPTATPSSNLLTNVTLTQDSQTGLYVITGRPSASGTGTVTLTVSHGGLDMPINVNISSTENWSPSMQGGSIWKYDVNLVSGYIPKDRTPWWAELLQYPAPANIIISLETVNNNVRMPGERNPNSNPVTWERVEEVGGRTSISSQEVANNQVVYIFVPSTASYSGTIKFTYIDNGQFVTRYYVLHN